jgi:hypothetical protein
MEEDAKALTSQHKSDERISTENPMIAKNCKEVCSDNSCRKLSNLESHPIFGEENK